MDIDKAYDISSFGKMRRLLRAIRDGKVQVNWRNMSAELKETIYAGMWSYMERAGGYHSKDVRDDARQIFKISSQRLSHIHLVGREPYGPAL